MPQPAAIASSARREAHLFGLLSPASCLASYSFTPTNDSMTRVIESITLANLSFTLANESKTPVCYVTRPQSSSLVTRVNESMTSVIESIALVWQLTRIQTDSHVMEFDALTNSFENKSPGKLSPQGGGGIHANPGSCCETSPTAPGTASARPTDTTRSGPDPIPSAPWSPIARRIPPPDCCSPVCCSATETRPRTSGRSGGTPFRP